MGKQSVIPVTVIGGYLGSGKTTLVNHLIHQANGKRLAIMVNEFGELPIDEDLIEAEGDELISLAGGCVCCSFGSDLINAMNKLAALEHQPDNVVIEASGVALPGSIASTLSLLPHYSIDGVVVLADAETIQQRAKDKFMADTILRQLSDADIILLNKADLVPKVTLDNTQEWLNSVSGNVPLLQTQNATVSPAIILQDFEWSAPTDIEKHTHQLPFDTQSFSMNERVDPNVLIDTLFEDYPTLVRAKGFIQNLEGQLQTLQIVGKRAEVTPAPANTQCGLVVIYQP